MTQSPALAGVPTQEPLSAELRYRLGSALRLSGEHAQAIESLASAIASEPEEHGWRYDLGLACKSAGQFATALVHFQAYAAAKGNEDEGLLWNLAICATGAGRGALARDQWHAMGMTDTTLGDDGLPRVPDLGRITVRIRRSDDTLIEVDATNFGLGAGILDVLALAVEHGVELVSFCRVVDEVGTPGDARRMTQNT